MIINGSKQEKEVNIGELEMIYPFFKMAAKNKHESGSVECTKPGRYWFVFRDESSWLQKEIRITMQLSDGSQTRRYHIDGTYSLAKPFKIFEM